MFSSGTGTVWRGLHFSSNPAYSSAMWRERASSSAIYPLIVYGSSEFARYFSNGRAVPARMPSLEASPAYQFGKWARLVALSMGLLPVVVWHGERTLRRYWQNRRRRSEIMIRTQHADHLMAQAAAVTAQPLAIGSTAADALRAIIDAGLCWSSTTVLQHRLFEGLRPNAPHSLRMLALLACRIEALHRSVSGGGVAGGTASPSSSTCAIVRHPDRASSAALAPTTTTAQEGNCEEAPSASDFATCRVCLDAPVDAVLAPCGHLAACLGCLQRMTQVIDLSRASSARLRCPVCVTPVSDVLRAFAC